MTLIDTFEEQAEMLEREWMEAEEGVTMSKQLAADAPAFDEPYLRLFEERIWNNEDRALVAFNESEVPQMVLDRLREVILGGSVFSDIESIPSSQLQELRTTLADSLADEGWSIRGLTDTLQERFGLDESRAELIARSETSNAVNAAREQAYQERFEGRDEEPLFTWQGPSDHRSTAACEWLKEQTNPKYGGDPVPIDRLKELIQEAPKHDPELDDNMAREWSVHPNERHTYTRHVE